jgi:hypothetical protein
MISLLTVMISVFLIMPINLIGQVNQKLIAGYQYAQYGGSWFSIVDGEKGDLVDITRIVVRLRDKGHLENYDFSKDSLPNLEIKTPRFVNDFYECRIPKGKNSFDIMQALERTGKFETIHFSPYCEVRSVPNDPLFENQWNLPQVQMPEAWNIIQSNTYGILLSIIDTGVVMLQGKS